MIGMKTIGAVAILAAAVASPVFAQDARTPGHRMEQHKLYQSYDQVNAPYAAPRTKDESWNLENFGITGRDPSRVGGESPWLNPPS
jgi:hypothetical protein